MDFDLGYFVCIFENVKQAEAELHKTTLLIPFTCTYSYQQNICKVVITLLLLLLTHKAKP